MKTHKPKFLILLICFLAFSFNAVAQETIKFDVSGLNPLYPSHRFEITASEGEQFTINWGDGSDVETVTGTGINYQEIRHLYTNIGNYSVVITGVEGCLFFALSPSSLGCGSITHLDVSKSPSLRYLFLSRSKISTLDLKNNAALTILYCDGIELSTLILNNNVAFDIFVCRNNQLNSLDLRSSTALSWFSCEDNQLSSLNLNSNKLTHFTCQNNKLHLSNIYEISQTINIDPEYSYEIIFGEQRLIPQFVEIGEQIDYSAEKEFLGNATVFTIEKDGIPALESEYTINDGVITFNTKGKYRVSMTNSAITVQIPYSSPVTPPIVIADIEVGNVGISETIKEKMKINVYPNPTAGDLSFTSYNLQVSSIDIFDNTGKKLSSHHQITSSSNHLINISHLPSGIYFAIINTDEGIVVKKVIKQ